MRQGKAHKVLWIIVSAITIFGMVFFTILPAFY
jgi:hypothetical protein